jgi:VWFA-related protein
LETGNPKRRRVILLISEGRDHGSETSVERAMERLQRANVTVYALLYSPFLTAWTVKSGARVGDEDAHDSMPALQQGGMDLIPLIVGAASAGKLATAKMLARFTGGAAISFAKKDALERAIAKAGEDLHSQYLLTFEDTAPADGRLHSIAVQVDSPNAIVRSRQAFWRGAH